MKDDFFVLDVSISKFGKIFVTVQRPWRLERSGGVKKKK